MKVRPCINCYTITFDEKSTFLAPGIPTQLFKGQSSHETEELVLNASPICRFAIEDKFKQLSNSSNKRWVVIDKAEPHYYRFFRLFPVEANDCVYILLSCKSVRNSNGLDNAELLSIGNNQFFIKMPRNHKFLFNDKNIIIRNSDILIK